MTERASKPYIPQLIPMIECGTWYCVENKKKKKSWGKYRFNALQSWFGKHFLNFEKLLSAGKIRFETLSFDF